MNSITIPKPGPTLRDVARRHGMTETLADRIEHHARLPEHARRTPERCCDLLEIADAVRLLEGAAHTRQRRRWWQMGARRV